MKYARLFSYCFLSLLSTSLLADDSLGPNPNASAYSSKADLTGTGHLNRINVTKAMYDNSLTSFTVGVDAARLTVDTSKDDMDECDGISVVQIDGSSRQRQMTVSLFGSDDRIENYLFGYDGKHIYKIGMLGSNIDVPGNGAVYTTNSLSFWTATEKFVVNLKKRRIDNVPQPSYYVGVTATAKAAFPILQSRTASASPAAVVAPGSKFTVLTFTPDTVGQLSDPRKGWYLIKSQTNLCGWARLDTFMDNQTGLVMAS